MKHKRRIQAFLTAGLLLMCMSACVGKQQVLDTHDVSGSSASGSVFESGPEVQHTPAADAALDRLTVVSRPVRTEYLSGETFDPEGLRIDAYYTDGGVIEDVPFEVEEPVIKARATAVTVTCLGKKLNISISVTNAGNAAQYSVAETPVQAGSPVKGNMYLWLGSSVTFGAASEGESVPDFFAKKWDCECIKEAVSGTTLTAKADNSYVDRLEKYLNSADRAEHLDGFICQLSTNDTRYADSYGLMMPSFITGADAFDTETTYGAIEYIIAKVKETWNCPVYFYVNPPYKNADYEKLAEGFLKIAEKWDVTVIDLFHDTEFNRITDEQRALYMDDTIHPTKAGYKEWWLPKFEEALLPG